MPRIACIEDILIALPLNSDDPSDKTNLSNQSNKTADFKGIDHLSEYICSATPQVYYNRGLIYSKQGKYQRAIEDYDEAIRLDPKLGIAYFGRGNTYSKLHHYRQAIKDFSEAIRIDPNYIGAYNNRGICYGELGCQTLSIKDYSEIIRIDPKNARAYNNRGVIYDILGQKDRALTDWRKACELGDCKRLNWAKKEGLC
jgi:tetratricopeptide (TPR) repeat protein